MAAGGKWRKAVYISTFYMIQSIFASAYIKGVAVCKKRLSAKLFYSIRNYFCIIGAEKCQIAGLSEVHFNGSIFSVKINVFDTGLFDQAFQFVQKSVVKSGSHAGIVYF